MLKVVLGKSKSVRKSWSFKFNAIRTTHGIMEVEFNDMDHYMSFNVVALQPRETPSSWHYM